MSENEEVPRALLDLLLKAERAKPVKSIVRPGAKETCACHRQVSPDLFSPLNTGVCMVRNNVCRGCKEGAAEDAKTARIVCAGCGSVMMRVPPEKDSDGFVFVANRSYHVQRCMSCADQKDLAKDGAAVVEKALYLRKVLKRNTL